MSRNTICPSTNAITAKKNKLFLVMDKSYYGEYGCRAVNELGVASKSLQVSGE